MWRRKILAYTAQRRSRDSPLTRTWLSVFCTPIDKCSTTAPRAGIETFMSKGPGQVQRAIMAAFESEPDNAFLLSELCEHAYPRIKRIEKKHRVAVARAAKTIKTIDSIQRQTLGRELVFYDPLNVMSYAMARLKSDFIDGEDYRNNDPRKAQLRKRSKRKATTEQDLRKRLAPGERQHKHIVKGGAWWRHTEIERAKKRGDRKTLKRLQAQQNAINKALGIK